MKTQNTPAEYQHVSPAGAEVRLLMNNHLGGMAHCTLKEGVVSKAVRHKTVSEFWYIYASRMKFRNLTFKNTCIFDTRDHAIGYERTNPYSN
jgi:hypothetical protein